MQIFKLHTAASGEIFALIDPRLTPPGVKRSTFYIYGMDCRRKSVDDFVFETPGKYSSVPMIRSDLAACWVSLSDLTKCKVHTAGDGIALIDLASVPKGMRRSTCRNYLALSVFNPIPHSTREQIESGRFVGPDPDSEGWREGPGLGQGVFALVYLGDLLTHAQNRTVTVLNAVSGSALPKKFDGRTVGECFDIYQAWVREEPVNGVSRRTREGGNAPLTPLQLLAAKAEWSARLKQKVEASDAEAKRKDREQVLVDIDPEDYL
jgi:hypothetical protein